jgi:hypothetical protein
MIKTDLEITTYWNGTRAWSPLSDVLHSLIDEKLGGPYRNALHEGPTRMEDPQNAKLDKLRRAKNVYYDVFNNGGCNYSNAEIRKVLGLSLGSKKCLKRYDDGSTDLDFDAIHAAVEPMMDRLVLAAAREQGVRNPEHTLFDLLEVA